MRLPTLLCSAGITVNYGRGVSGKAALNTVVMCPDLRKRTAGQARADGPARGVPAAREDASAVRREAGRTIGRAAARGAGTGDRPPGRRAPGAAAAPLCGECPM
ncbi:hypothetical protein GCM10010524_44010 [Streptomyces mexicanus]